MAESINYFKSYGDLSVHELMLNDERRTLTYGSFMLQNANIFKDKIVLDVGAGTGILSMFAARAGALKVFAVEASSIVEICKAVVSKNGFSEVIEVLHSSVESAELPVKQVDIIISEWMGFYLLHESMIQSVIFARDKWLKPDGLMVPSEAKILVCPVQLEARVDKNVAQWKKMYGFDFSPLSAVMKKEQLLQPEIRSISAEHLVADPYIFAQFNMHFVDTDEIRNVSRPFSFKSEKHTVLTGFAVWFVCDFSFDGDQSLQQIVLDTGPVAPCTHWKQTIIHLPSGVLISKGDNINGTLELQQNTDSERRYDLTICLREDSSDEEEEEDNEKLVESCDTSEAIEEMILKAMGNNE